MGNALNYGSEQFFMYSMIVTECFHNKCFKLSTLRSVYIPWGCESDMILSVMTCIQIWNYINTRHFGKLHEKLNIRQFLYADKTDCYLQFMSNYMTWSVYLGSICDSPGRIKVTGQFVNGDVTLCKGCVFDYLTIQWDNINLSLYDLDLKFPSNHPVSLTSKFF